MRTGLFALLGAVSCLLLIACVNVATLLLGRSNARRREFAVRVALGAGKVRLMSQVLVETLLLFVSGAILGIVCASWAVGIIKTSLGDRLPRLSETAIDWTVLGYTAAICLAAGVLFGLVPASQAVNANIGEAMSENSRVGGSGLRSRRLWSVLIVALLNSWMWTTILGIVIGSAGALAGGRALRSLLFGVSADDFLAFSGSALLLILALLSSYVPARRAMRVDPGVVLRSE